MAHRAALAAASIFLLPACASRSPEPAGPTSSTPFVPRTVVGQPSLESAMLAPPPQPPTFVFPEPSESSSDDEVAPVPRADGAQRSLAHYLDKIHARVHPWFADRFLAELDALPKDHPLNDQRLATVLEVSIAPNGRLASLKVAKPSGNVTFDGKALESFERAAPFAPTPEAIRAKDRNLWLRWEMKRDEVFACSTKNAQRWSVDEIAR